MIALLMLGLAGWCGQMAWRAWAGHRRLSAAAVTGAREERGRVLPRLGRHAPRRLRELAPPWACDSETANRGARATGLSLDELGALRAGALLVFGGVSLVSLLAVGGATGVLVAAVVAGFGAAYPDLWLRSAAARRTVAIDRAVPLALDLVAVTVASGVDLDVALQAATAAATGALGEELELSARRIELGALRRDELRDLATRTGSEGLGGLALAVGLADRMGVPLSDSLAAQARRARRDRARAVEERAAKASPKVLVVVVFVLVPAALIPILAAVALSVAGAFNGSGL